MNPSRTSPLRDYAAQWRPRPRRGLPYPLAWLLALLLPLGAGLLIVRLAEGVR